MSLKVRSTASKTNFECIRATYHTIRVVCYSDLTIEELGDMLHVTVWVTLSGILKAECAVVPLHKHSEAIIEDATTKTLSLVFFVCL